MIKSFTSFMNLRAHMLEKNHNTPNFRCGQANQLMCFSS